LAGGQSVGHAAAGSLATGAGSFAGAAIGGFLGGPLGAFVGGYLGGSLAGGLFDLAFPPSTGESEPPSTYTPRRDLPAGVTLEFYSPNNQSTVIFPNIVSWRIEEDRRFPFPHTIYFRRTFDTETEGNTYINPDTLRIIGPIPAERPSNEPNKDARRIPHAGTPAGAPYDPPTPNPAGNQSRPAASNSGSGLTKAPGANPNANLGPAATPAAQPRNITMAGPGTGIASSPSNNPASSPSASPSPFNQAQPGPQNRGGNFSPSPFNLPAGAPAPGMGATPTPQNPALAPAPRTATISSSPQTGPTPQVPDAFRPPTPPPQPETVKASLDPDLISRLTKLEELITGSNTKADINLKKLDDIEPKIPDYDLIKKASKDGICEEAQPDGCLGKPMNDIKNDLDDIGDALDELKGKDNELKKAQVSVVIVDCIDGKAVESQAVISCLDGLQTQVQKEFQQFANIRKELCENCDCIASVPEWWQVRIEADRPQLIIQFGPDLGNGKIDRQSRWSLSLPHYYKPKDFKPNIPGYTKGSKEAILTLKDNSKLIVNAVTVTEAKRVIKALKLYINPKYLPGRITTGTREYGEDELKELKVAPTKADFFATGLRNMEPDWTIRLNK
jgi:hypothetical protein